MSRKKYVYLAGAIEAAPDKGKRWRTIITPKLEKLGYAVINPYLDLDGKILEDYGWATLDHKKIRTQKYRKDYFVVMEKIVKEDIRAVLKSKFIIVYFDRYVQKGAGTYGEVTLARYKNIPVYVVLAGDQSFEDIPAWVVGCTTQVFNSFKELRTFLNLLGEK